MQPYGQSQSSMIPALGLYILRLIRESWASSVELFLHRSDLGSRYLWHWSGGGVLLIPLYSGFWAGHDQRPLIVFYVLYLVLLVYHRVGGLIRGTAVRRHSYYPGTPRLAALFPRMRDRTLRLYVEPALVFGVAFLVDNHNLPLCFYLIGASFCLFLSTAEADRVQQRQAMEMNDAVIDQQGVTERFREMQGRDRW